jgi:hypothetical protein
MTLKKALTIYADAGMITGIIGIVGLTKCMLDDDIKHRYAFANLALFSLGTGLIAMCVLDAIN